MFYLFQISEYLDRTRSINKTSHCIGPIAQLVRAPDS